MFKELDHRVSTDTLYANYETTMASQARTGIGLKRLTIVTTVTASGTHTFYKVKKEVYNGDASYVGTFSFLEDAIKEYNKS